MALWLVGFCWHFFGFFILPTQEGHRADVHALLAGCRQRITPLHEKPECGMACRRREEAGDGDQGDAMEGRCGHKAGGMRRRNRQKASNGPNQMN